MHDKRQGSSRVRVIFRRPASVQSVVIVKADRVFFLIAVVGVFGVDTDARRRRYWATPAIPLTPKRAIHRRLTPRVYGRPTTRSADAFARRPAAFPRAIQDSGPLLPSESGQLLHAKAVRNERNNVRDHHLDSPDGNGAGCTGSRKLEL